MSFFRSAARGLAEARATRSLEVRAADPRLPWGDSTPPPPSLVGANAAGIPVTQEVASGIAAVYGCCSLIADTVSSLPIELRTGPDRATSKALPLSPLLKRPYAEISRRDWWIMFIWSLALRGNFYGRYIERDAAGRPVQIKPIHNDAVQVYRNSQTGAITYRFYGEVVPLRDVFHVRYQTTSGNIIGMNPIQLMALTFGNAVAKERYVESFYLNQSTPFGVIQVPGYLDRVEVRKMQRAWMAAHQGLNKAHLPAILTENAEFKPITISPSDSQLLESLNFSNSQIAGLIFRVPPHMVGIIDKTTSWGRGIEQQERGFFSNTLVGYLDIGRESLTDLHAPGQFVHFDNTKRERGATLERAQAAALLMNSGVGLADDLRGWFDWAALPSGDGQYSYLPINTQLLEAALLALQQAKEPPPPALPPAEPGGGTPTSAQGPPRTPAGARPTRPAPARPAVPAGRSANGNGNGHAMTRDEAIYVLETALAQARRAQWAADQAMQIHDPAD